MRRQTLLSLVAALVFMGLSSTSLAAGGCKQQQMWNPVTANWNNAFPIVVAGLKTDSGSHPFQPGRMREKPICKCGHYSIPVGVGMTYWQPTYVAEVVDNAGCLPAMGGKKVLSGPLASKAQSNRDEGAPDPENISHGQKLRNMSVHWYNYPVFSLLEVFSTLACNTTAGFDIADMTELDPTWSHPLLADMLHPLTFLVANIFATAACIPDAVAATAYLPINSLFWCMGSQGTLYPNAGWVPQELNGIADANFHMLGKFMQGRVQFGGMLTTIGPEATCTSMYKPVLTRDQYRFEPILPVGSNRTAIMGASALKWAFTPPLNPNPSRVDNTFLIWQGKQCCVL